MVRPPPARPSARGPTPLLGLVPGLLLASVAAAAGERATPPPARTRALAELRWGSGVGELGRSRPDEGNPEAPMSLARAADANVVIVDQVNGRAVRLDRDGRWLGALRLPVRAAQDVAIARDGTLAFLDRLVDRRVGLVSARGAPGGTLPLEGPGLAEGAEATGLFVDGDTVAVEREHGPLVTLGDVEGHVVARRRELPGRPTCDRGAFVTARKVARRALELTAIERATGVRRYVKRYTFPGEVHTVSLLDSDDAGRLYLGARGVDGSAPARAFLQVLCLDGRTGRVTGRIELAPNDDADETFRELAASEGGVLYLRRTERAATLLEAPCRPP